jgi:transposase
MDKGTRIMVTGQELDRIRVVKNVLSKKVTQSEAGVELGISLRQVKRLVKQYRSFGEEGLISSKRGGNRAFSTPFKTEVMKLIKETYADFKPTFAGEKLLENHNISVNKETLRQWMIEDDLWKGKRRAKARIHQSRTRRSRRGELVQLDGSPHDWFEGRAPNCTLLVLIDDATSELLALRFEAAETTLGYFRLLKDYLKNHGRPEAFYSDKHGVFNANKPCKIDGKIGTTQYQRAMKVLQIEIIFANSPQAKGRVERANSTLQDRLTKEMRLKNICSMEEGNAFLEPFMRKYNARFAVEAAEKEDAHRPLTTHQLTTLDTILAVQETRKVSKNLEFSYCNQLYQIQSRGGGYHLRNATIHVCEQTDTTITLAYKDKPLTYKVLKEIKRLATVTDAKEVNVVVDLIVKRTFLERKKELENANQSVLPDSITRGLIAAPLNPARVFTNISNNLERIVTYTYGTAQAGEPMTAT